MTRHEALRLYWATRPDPGNGHIRTGHPCLNWREALSWEIPAVTEGWATLHRSAASVLAGVS